MKTASTRPGPPPSIFFYTVLLLAVGITCKAEIAPKKEPRSSYYQNPLSFGTTRDPDPPKYVRSANEIGIDSLLNAKWLDVGIDYRFRYEYREGDLRRPMDSLDQPLLHRTRAYIGIKEILDPFRFAFEMQDSRRENSQFVRDTRDVNEFAVIRLYGELYFKSLFGHDALGNNRPLSVRFGIHNFDFLDRRLLANNQWRNTANTFKGFHASLGQESNDWQLDLLAIQPLTRQKYSWDTPVVQQWVYGAIGHLRGWSDVITFEPFYLALNQSAYPGTLEYVVHSPGLRVYGIVAGTGLDYDFSFIYQTGRNGTRKVDAYASTFEVGYTLASQPWKPRLSLFYGYASGDHNPSDNKDNRFQRFFGFGRAWSANDYITFQNVSTPTARIELKPHQKLRLDLNYSAYWLASATDVFSVGNVIQVQDKTGASGRFLGNEYDIRARYTWDAKTDIIIGYSYFQSGGYVQKQLHRDHTNFAYFELTRRFF
ncbi:alginate export family protein [Prosthecobacter fluviatilis]|uniref:Alginate export family protein n=1 Tax=Prosthecobacter fluviatilis TaxID=445931 RepID=A0ABW0KU60_9BACT